MPAHGVDAEESERVDAGRVTAKDAQQRRVPSGRASMDGGREVEGPSIPMCCDNPPTPPPVNSESQRSMGEGGTGWRQEKGFLVKEEMVRAARVCGRVMWTVRGGKCSIPWNEDIKVMVRGLGQPGSGFPAAAVPRGQGEAAGRWPRRGCLSASAASAFLGPRASGT